ncbi:hypothetical protein [Lentilactobacillus sp. Marseille-Q4993]|uniref:hypothetical protein n=1 Tax=Lentilactobacillus sp. Marseille-Q4993 TaxID=3039492 RepID=UPI0024BD37A9|nr:hypothetical protein [Lentilactobacillus sp. Marseille-Q4993]
MSKKAKGFTWLFVAVLAVGLISGFTLPGYISHKQSASRVLSQSIPTNTKEKLDSKSVRVINLNKGKYQVIMGATTNDSFMFGTRKKALLGYGKTNGNFYTKNQMMNGKSASLKINAHHYFSYGRILSNGEKPSPKGTEIKTTKLHNVKVWYAITTEPISWQSVEGQYN